MKPVSEPAKTIIIMTVLALSGFAVVCISILLKGLVNNILVQVDHRFFTHFIAIDQRLAEDAPHTDSRIVIVGIDDRTLDRLGPYDPAAFRRMHVKVLEELVKGRPEAVVYDILFAEPHPDPEVDLRLAAQMAKATVFSVCFGAGEDRSDGGFAPPPVQAADDAQWRFIEAEGFEPVSPPIERALAGVGLADAYPDTDGLIRRHPVVFKVGGAVYPGLSLEVFRQLKGGKNAPIVLKKGHVGTAGRWIPVDAHGRAYLRMDPLRNVRTVSFYDVYAGRIPPKYFEGRIVFVAATAAGLGDLKLIPYHGYVDGVQVHAQMLLSMLTGRFVRELSGWRYLAVLGALSLYYTWVFYNRRELSTIRRSVGWIQSFSLLTKIFNAALKVTFIRRAWEAFVRFREQSFGLRLFFLLFSEGRKRIDPLLFQFVLLYLALYLLYRYAGVFVGPAAVCAQLLLSFVVVSEFKRIDFSALEKPPEPPAERP